MSSELNEPGPGSESQTETTRSGAGSSESQLQQGNREFLSCKVIEAHTNGYLVDVRGLLQTEDKLAPGDELLVQLVSCYKGKLLVAPAGTAWSLTLPGRASDAAVQVLSSEDNAFEHWANGKPPYFKIRRATDWLMTSGAADGAELNGPDDLQRWIRMMEAGARTGCCKFSCDQTRSRGAILLHRGKCVGCIYSNQQQKDSLPTNEAVALLLNDCKSTGTQATVCDWPEEVVLSMAALFLGTPMEPSIDGGARLYMDQTMNLLAAEKSTGCLTFKLAMTGAILFAFVFQGEFVGSFYVEIQQFSRNKSFVYNLITQDPHASVSASVLPARATSDFGISLLHCLN